MELQASRCGRERSESDGKVQQLMGLTANGHNFRFRIGDPARIILFPTDTVDDMPFWVASARLGHGANQVDLVIFPGLVADVDIHHMIGIVQPEHGVGSVPVDIMNFSGLNLVDEKHQQKGSKNTC